MDIMVREPIGRVTLDNTRHADLMAYSLTETGTRGADPASLELEIRDIGNPDGVISDLRHHTRYGHYRPLPQIGGSYRGQSFSLLDAGIMAISFDDENCTARITVAGPSYKLLGPRVVDLNTPVPRPAPPPAPPPPPPPQKPPTGRVTFTGIPPLRDWQLEVIGVKATPGTFIGDDVRVELNVTMPIGFRRGEFARWLMDRHTVMATKVDATGTAFHVVNAANHEFGFTITGATFEEVDIAQNRIVLRCREEAFTAPDIQSQWPNRPRRG